MLNSNGTNLPIILFCLLKHKYNIQMEHLLFKIELFKEVRRIY